MVVLLLTFVSLSVVMSISIPLSCISLNGYIPTLGTSPSSTSLYIACSSTNRYSTPSSSDSSMYIKSTGVVLGLACSLELQPLLHLCKNYTIDVPDLYMFQIMECTNFNFSWSVFLPHASKMVNAMATSLPIAECSTFKHSLFFSTFLLLLFFFCFLILSMSMLTSLCFLLICYYLQFLNIVIRIHAFTNFEL